MSDAMKEFIQNFVKKQNYLDRGSKELLQSNIEDFMKEMRDCTGIDLTQWQGNVTNGSN